MDKHPELKYRTVVELKPRQEVNEVAEKLYRLNFDSTAKIHTREYKRTDTEIVYLVSDIDQIEPLYIIKKTRHGVQPATKQKDQAGNNESAGSLF